MLNPHKQLDANKKIIVEQCLYCHIEKPDEKYSGSKDIVLKSNIEVLCQRCHNIKGNHSGNANHMRKPSAKILKQMNIMKERFNIILPLDSEGKLTCSTCHNPHEMGVIAAQKPSAKGADDKYRHRLPGKMCTECHQM
jgi:nitrate/TMAO reductase-like tetraheme cytochrome c subunit